MKIHFRCSFYFQKYIAYELHNFKELMNFTRKFEKHIKPYLGKIIKKIEKYTGFEWQEKEITVWLIDGFLPSICFPFLLNWHEGNIDETIFAFVHEMVHNNLKDLYAKKGNDIDFILMEAVTNLVTKYVIFDIFPKERFKKVIDLEKKRSPVFEKIWKLEEELEKRIDLRKKPLKEYIKKDKRFSIKREWQKYVKVKKVWI